MLGAILVPCRSERGRSARASRSTPGSRLPGPPHREVARALIPSALAYQMAVARDTPVRPILADTADVQPPTAATLFREEALLLQQPVPPPQIGQFLLRRLDSRSPLPFSSSSAWASQFRRHDSLIPESLAILATGAVPSRANWTARCPNSSGRGPGITDILPCGHRPPQVGCPGDGGRSKLASAELRALSRIRGRADNRTPATAPQPKAS